MLREIKSRILLEDDVIKAVDKHTNEDGTLDNDISCILEEVKSVVIMGSKEAMSKLKANEPKYDFHVGDYVEDIDGNVGYIDFICNCEKGMSIHEYYEHHKYLSTHTFYGDTYQYSTKILQEHGFDVEIDNWDKVKTDD